MAIKKWVIKAGRKAQLLEAENKAGRNAVRGIDYKWRRIHHICSARGSDDYGGMMKAKTPRPVAFLLVPRD